MLIAHGLYLSVHTINVYINCHSIVSARDIKNNLSFTLTTIRNLLF